MNVRRRRKDNMLRTIKVLDAISAYAAEGKSPTIREMCVAIGAPSERAVWCAVNTLINLGVVEWLTDEHGRRVPRGVRLVARLNEPAKIPIIPTGDQGFMPGERWVEFDDDGIYYVDGDRRVRCGLVQIPQER